MRYVVCPIRLKLRINLILIRSRCIVGSQVTVDVLLFILKVDHFTSYHIIKYIPDVKYVLLHVIVWYLKTVYGLPFRARMRDIL